MIDPRGDDPGFVETVVRAYVLGEVAWILVMLLRGLAERDRRRREALRLELLVRGPDWRDDTVEISRVED